MICFEVKINGQKVCTAGIDSEYGIVTTILEWVKRDLKNFPVESRQNVLKEELKLDVSGSITHGRDDHENIEWVHRSMSVGDELNIKIIESSQIDEPKSRERSDPDFFEKAKRKYYEKLKQEYEND